MSPVVWSLLLLGTGTGLIVGFAIGGCYEFWKRGGSRELAKELNSAFKEIERLREERLETLRGALRGELAKDLLALNPAHPSTLAPVLPIRPKDGA